METNMSAHGPYGFARMSRSRRLMRRSIVSDLAAGHLSAQARSPDSCQADALGHCTWRANTDRAGATRMRGPFFAYADHNAELASHTWECSAALVAPDEGCI